MELAARGIRLETSGQPTAELLRRLQGDAADVRGAEIGNHQFGHLLPVDRTTRGQRTALARNRLHQVFFRQVADGLWREAELVARLQLGHVVLLQAAQQLGLPAGAVASMQDDELLEAIGRKRGAMLGGGRVNLQKAAEIVMTDFRTAILGRITLETPEQFEAWRAAGLAEDAKRQAKKDARAKARGKCSGVREPHGGDDDGEAE